MQLGIVQIAQSFGFDNITDGQVYDEELRSGILADELGYDLVSMVEHHFEDYALCPDNFVYLAHLAAKTRRIKLMMGDHFADVKGYEEYGETARVMQAVGMEGVADGYLAGQTWGTPRQILEKIEARRKIVGDFDGLFAVRFAGTSFEVVERTMKTFAKEVMPELKSWNIATTMAV